MTQVKDAEFTTPQDSQDARLLAAACHLAGFVGLIPFGNIIAPLIIWSLKRGDFPLVDDQGKEAVNFQITFLVGMVLSAVLTLVLVGWVFLVVLPIVMFVFVIIGAIKAYDGKRYRYPLNIRFIA